MEALGLSLSRHPLALLDRQPKGVTVVRLEVWVIRYQAPPTGEGRRVVYICAE